MSILPDFRILEAIELDHEPSGLSIEPYDRDNIGPNSIDLCLSGTIKRFYEPIPGERPLIVDPFDKESIEQSLRTDSFDDFTLIFPGEFVLASTIEKVTFPHDICAMVNGKSSIARLGISIHQTGGWIDAGFQGTITLEMTNVSPTIVKLYKRMKICQIVFFRCEPVALSYCDRLSSKYNNQSGPTSSRYYLNE